MLACCAFAVFLLNQLLLPLTFIRERLWGKKPPGPNTAVIWNPGTVGAALRTRRRLLRPAVVLVLFVESLAIGGSVAAATLAAQAGAHVGAGAPSAEQRLLTALHNSICHVLGRANS